MPSSTPVFIIDCGIGNVASVANILRRVGGSSYLTRDVSTICKAQKIILPGVGAFDSGISALQNAGLVDALKEAVVNGAYLFGICLGMQILLGSSEEGELPGLGLIEGQVKRFRVEEQGLRVPHMGWNNIKPKPEAILFDDLIEEYRFYFVHSFFAECASSCDIAATAFYGQEFVCAVQHERILGVQFHPEKSHKFGMNLFKNFIELPC